MRHGRYRPEDFERLHRAQPFDLIEATQTWLAALDAAASFASERPPGEIGCLYYSTREARFVAPRADTSLADQGVQLYFGTPGGVLPQLTDARIEELFIGSWREQVGSRSEVQRFRVRIGIDSRLSSARGLL